MFCYSRNSCFFKKAAAFLVVIFLFNSIIPSSAVAQALISLPVPGTMVQPSAAFTPACLKGVKVDPKNPLVMDFVVDPGNSGLTGDTLQAEGQKLIKYFLTSMTVPENELWVNLSPYEPDRIVSAKFGQTEMGRDLLAQDYILKQLSASLSNPDTQLGKDFWQRIYARAEKEFGLAAADIPTDMFNKVWIMPAKAVVYENGNVAYIKGNQLKVMLEADYLAMENQAVAQEKGATSELAKQVVREVIIPELTREVNEGQNFATLRQVYNSMLLAYWYKVKVKESILGKAYLNKNKIAGEELEDKTAKDQIYARYVEAFKKGAYNFIKEDVDANSNETIPRKYFSGGAVSYSQAPEAVVFDAASVPVTKTGENQFDIKVRLNASQRTDAQEEAATFQGNVAGIEEQTDLKRFRAVLKDEDRDFVSTEVFAKKATQAYGSLFDIDPLVHHKVGFRQVADGILPRGFAVGRDTGEVYIEQSLVESPDAELLFERLGLMVLSKPGQEYEVMFRYA
ncbi:MAG: hypothetical protein HQL22_11095, partial [Candidatus Omnitrophica bacterium]|nr:hypothetical protein [Candidatus Omnitrophota bacterium]